MRAIVAEKLLLALLAKLANPRPDDSDILSRNDMSIVRVADLRRLTDVCRDMFTASGQSAFLVRQEIKAFIDAMYAILATHRLDPSTSLSEEECRVMAELLEQTAGAYWWCYNYQGFSGQVAELRIQHVLALLDLVQRYANQTLGAQPASNGVMHALPIPHPSRETERVF
jgi:hypothetical protein